LGGGTSILYAHLLFVSPLIEALVLTWWMGNYALVLGVSLVVLAFQLRRHRGEHFPAAVAAPI